jgi:protein SCO1/2
MRRSVHKTTRWFVTFLVLVTPIVFAALPEFDRTLVLQEGRAISDSMLTDQFGEPFGLGQLSGRVAFVFFGFTNCPDVCPMTMSKYKQLQDSGSVDTSEVAFVLISVDGERDTPAAMKKFLDLFSPQFIGLTSEPQKVKKIAKEFRASFFRGSSSDDIGGYSVAHSPQVFVLDPTGRLRAEMYDPSVEAMAGMVDALLTEARESAEAQE